MFLSKNQKKVLKILHKNGDTMLYYNLHKHKYFKTDYAVQSAVESLKSIGYLHYVVYKANPKTLTSKSSDMVNIVLDRFEYVDYLESSNRLFISERGISYLQEGKHNLLSIIIPYVITTAIAVASIICQFLH